MRICHVTPHLPPDQAANALLPFHLGNWARAAGEACCYVSHVPRQAAPVAAGAIGFPGPVTWIAAPRRSRGFARHLATLRSAATIARVASRVIATADIVHIHSNGLLPEVCAWLATRQRKRVVLTLYGTEIWHYARRRWRPDLFTRAYQAASAVTFYSHGLMARAVELGLERSGMHVIYPPVADEFRPADAAGRARTRQELGLRDDHVLVNVKRLHPLAGQRYLIQAMPEIVRQLPSTHLIVCGTGPLDAELRAVARDTGVGGQVTFTGLVDNATIARYDAAADVFVLPSLLEACPTVALEALACGTPVVSSDNPGGVELNRMFGDDVAVVPREDVGALASAVVERLRHGRRVGTATTRIIEQDLRPPAVWTRFRAIYGGPQT